MRLLFKLIAIVSLTILHTSLAQAQAEAINSADEVAARVNGKAIMLSVYQTTLQANGGKSWVLDYLIGQELLVQRSKYVLEVAPERAAYWMQVMGPGCIIRSDSSYQSIDKSSLSWAVIGVEVGDVLLSQLTEQQKREYYEKHPDLTTKPFSDPEVQQIVTDKLAEEVFPTEFVDQKIVAYMEKLRSQAVIEINPKYRLEENKIK